MNDEDLYHEFRKCMFARQIKSGIYVFRNRENGDYMNYRITNKSYNGSYGVYNAYYYGLIFSLLKKCVQNKKN